VPVLHDSAAAPLPSKPKLGARCETRGAEWKRADGRVTQLDSH
jgi:hypothetical protein